MGHKHFLRSLFEAVMTGMCHGHSHPKEEHPNVVFIQKKDGKWYKEGILIETDSGSGYIIKIGFYTTSLGIADTKEEDLLVCYAPHLFVLIPFLASLYNGRTPKFTSVHTG